MIFLFLKFEESSIPLKGVNFSKSNHSSLSGKFSVVKDDELKSLFDVNIL